MNKRLIITAIAVVLFATGSSTVFPQYYLGVIKGEAKKIPIVVIDLYNDTGSPGLRTLALEVLQADLRRSQIFDVMDAKKLDLVYAGKDDPPADAIKRGGTFGLSGVAWARLSRKGSDITLSGRLYDAVTGMRMTSKEYYGNEDLVRRMVHTFADEIVSQYTGEKGVAKTRIACVSDKTGHKELYVMDYDGQNLKKLTADRSISMSPAWSPDGRVLAYVSYRDRNPDLFGLDMESGRRWKISGAEGLNISPAWAPNGKRLALALSKDGGTEIYTMTMEGNDIERLTYGIADNVSPARPGDCIHVGPGRISADLHYGCGRGRCAPDHLRRTVQCLAPLVPARGSHCIRFSGEGAVQDRNHQSRRLRFPNYHDWAGQ
jgi:tol-pal system beta propeller repeat protein TolB